MDWKFLFLSANGRIGQKDFWIGILILFVVNVIASLIPTIGQIISLLLIYPAVCVTSKRLHDMGKTGWLAAIPYGLTAVAMVPLIFAGFAAMAAGGASVAGSAAGVTAGAGAALGLLAIAGMLMMIAGLVCLAFLLWVGLSKGDAGTNQYGPPQPSMFSGGSTTTPAI